MKSMCENGKERLYIFEFTRQFYIYESTTNTVWHNKTMHEHFVPTNRLQSYHKK